MSFIKKLKVKGRVYAIEVEGYRDSGGKVRHRYLRYLGRVTKDGKIIPSQNEIVVEKVEPFGWPFVVRQAKSELKRRKKPAGEEQIAMFIEQRLRENGLQYTTHRAKEILLPVYKVTITRGKRKLERISRTTKEQDSMLKVFGFS